MPGADVVNRLFGPMTPELAARLPEVESYFGWMASMCDRRILRPGSWGAAILDAVDAGTIDHHDGVWLMNGYLVAGMDTTVNALSSLLALFAERPDVWNDLKQHPEFAGSAFEEIIRLQSPIQGFFRVTTEEVHYDGGAVPAGARVLLSFGAANRDPRHYPDPDTFDLRRNPVDHVGFGYGPHGCAGQALARLESVALLQSLITRVESFAPAADPVRRIHPIIRGYASVPVTVQPRH